MGAAYSVTLHGSTSLRALNYSAEVEALQRSRRGRESIPLGELVGELGAAYRTAFVRRDCSPELGVQCLSQSDMFATEPAGRVIRRDSFQHPSRHEIRRWQILIAGAGTLAETELFGRSIIADVRLAGKYMCEDTLALTFNNPGGTVNLYAAAFLATRVGIRAVRSTGYGTKTLKLRRDMLRNVPIPMPDDAIQNRVAALMRRCIEQQDFYYNELLAARKVLEDLPVVAEAHAICADTKARCVVWDGPLPTMCAWNFASTGRALAHLSRAWSTRLGDVLRANGMFNGPRFARIPCEEPHGVEFLSQRDVFLIRPPLRRIRHPGFDDHFLFVPEDALLLGSHGQINEGSIFGRVELAACGGSRRAITQDVLRMLPVDGWRAILYAFLSTRLGLHLLRGTAIGTSIPSMRLDLVARIPAPELDSSRMSTINRHVGAAINARQAADAAEAEAIRIVEEEVLPVWLG